MAREDGTDVGHELLEHTADSGFRAWAPTLDELFAEAARALIGLMGRGGGPIERSEDVALEAPDAEALLVDWLSELLFLFEARSVVPAEIDVEVSENPWRLAAMVRGPDASGFVQEGPQVKAVTYHDLEIARTGSGYEARVYVDV